MDAMNGDQTIEQFVNDAAELAARALGCGLARAFEVYLPARLVSHFAMRVAVSLLREVSVREVGTYVARKPD